MATRALNVISKIRCMIRISSTNANQTAKLMNTILIVELVMLIAGHAMAIKNIIAILVMTMITIFIY